MTPLVTQVTAVLGYLTAIGDALIAVAVILLVVFAFDKRASESFHASGLSRFLDKRALLLALIVPLASMVGSLFYSDYAGFAACNLCWYARVLFYPQVIVAFVAILTKDRKALTYILWLSILGAALTAFHYYGQMFNASALPCGVNAAVSACAQRPFVALGYVTIPMMAFTGFVGQILIVVHARLSERFNTHNA